MKTKTKFGLTLIELMIAVAIAAILSIMGLSSYVAAQKKGRDARRREEILAVQKAFEQYYSQNNSYNNDCSVMAAGSLQGGLVTAGPKGDSYNPRSCSSSGYCYCASMEITGSGNSSGDASGSCSFGTGNWFCVTNLQ